MDSMWLQSCISCGTRCCRKFLVALTPYDVERISRKLNKPAVEFVEAFPAEKCACVYAPIFWLYDDEFYIGMKRRDGGCIFLKDGRCAIHDFKPLVCRTFPYCIENGEIKKNPFCKNDVLKEADTYALLLLYENKLRLMRSDAIEWNLRTAGKRGLADLMEFLRKKERERNRITKLISKCMVD